MVFENQISSQGFWMKPLFALISLFCKTSRYNYKSSHRRCSVKKGVLKNCASFTGKHLCWSLFLIELQGVPFLYPLKTSDVLQLI